MTLPLRSDRIGNFYVEWVGRSEDPPARRQFQLRSVGRRCARPTLRACLSAAFLLLIVSALHGQETQPPIDRKGTHALRAILKQKFGLKPVTRADVSRGQEETDRNKLLMVVLGNPDHLEVFGDDELKKYVIQDGGALLVATDQKTGAALQKTFGVKVSGDFFQIDADSSHAYLQMMDCPLVTDFRKGHPIARQLSKVATNRPSNIVLRNANLQSFAWLPADVFWEDNPLRSPFRKVQDRVIAAGAEFPSGGRILVLADHSIFINDMMLRDDNENFFFASNCIDWLTNGRKRTHVIFYEDGNLVDNFNVSFKEIPPPPLPTEGQLVDAANQMLANLDNQDFFNNLIPERIRQELVRLGLVLGTGVLAFYGLRRLGQARQRIDRNDPLFTVALQQLAPAGTVTQRRHAHLQATNNYGEMAQHLARQAFPPHAGSTVPVVVVKGSWWHRFLLRRRVQRLWRLAISTVPQKISAQRLRHVQDEIHRMQTAVADGTIQSAIGNRQSAVGGRQSAVGGRQHILGECDKAPSG